MKKLLFAFFMVVLLGQQGVWAQNGNGEKQMVARFLSFMHAERGPNYPEMMNCISPAYLKENNIDVKAYKVNNYTIWGFNIESFSETDQIVYANIYGQKKSWGYHLGFKVSKENGRFYIIPSSFDTEWIHPWWGEVETIENLK
jgi:hypothetical protein